MTERGRQEVPGSRFEAVHATLEGTPLSVMRIPFGDDIGLLSSVVRSLLETLSPGCLVSLGTAMACSPDIEIGDVVVSQGAWHRGRSVDFGGWFEEELLRAVPHDLRVRRSRSITARAFVSGPAERDRLLAGNPGAGTIEMEDFHVASLAAEFGAGFASIRAVTDRGDFTDHMARRRDAARAAIRLLRRGLRQRRMTKALTTLDNPPTADLPFRLLITAEAPLDIPDAIGIARRAVAAFGLQALLRRGARVDIRLSGAPALPRQPATPSGQAKLLEEPGSWAVVLDPVSGWAELRLLEDAARSGTLAAPGACELARALDLCPVAVQEPEPADYTLAAAESFHIQGLNSISAEPEEGLLAATTICEFREAGLQVADSASANAWIYRSAHASHESYFRPSYAVPARVSPDVPAGTFLIATGLGPAIDPLAEGGREADLLLLGDEQAGRLIHYLDDLAAGSFSAGDALRYEGLAHRLGERAVALGRLDRRPLLTSEGMNSLRYDPQTLRTIYSREYDDFLERYFSARRREERPKASHLLLTSRGCGYQCSFCCSGGMQPFSALGLDVLVEMLREVQALDEPAAGEHVAIYLLDSYFNRNPERVIRLAERLESEALLGCFEFYVRHNGLQAFLKRRGTPDAAPVVNTRLIEAYKKLGIDEIVMGVDAYTDESIRMLKTNFDQLVSKGEEAQPLYTFADIDAVLTEIEAAGLLSRCFLLVYNPFASDRDRVSTFYNLLDLASRLPGFKIDSTSSDRVNELKPFPGAPLTRVAEQMPGLVRGDRFDYATPLGRIEELLDLPMFGARRHEPAAMDEFAARARAARRRLGLRLVDTWRDLAPADRPRVAAAVARFAQEERRLRDRFARVAATPEAAAAEAELALIVEQLREVSVTNAPGAPEPSRFYEALKGRRSKLEALLPGNEE